ncbi:MAG: NUDIX domain-containing protein [Patescibacteria group bacterium]
MDQSFHLRVRVVICSKERSQILVVRQKGGRHVFLPGGHYEVGESLQDTAVRETREELGITVVSKCYLGVVENDWVDLNTHQYEINHVFEVIPTETLSESQNPNSREDHLEFLWISTDDFEKENLLPTNLREPLKQYLATGLSNPWYILNS